MSEQKPIENKNTNERKKPKFGARLARATASGTPLSFLFLIINYFFSVAVNRLANEVIIDPIAFGIVGFAIGISASIATEISKDFES